MNVFNNLNQPVELHFGQRVVIIPPLGKVTLEESMLTSPQVIRLRDSGALLMQEESAAEAQAPQGEADAPAGASEAETPQVQEARKERKRKPKQENG